MATRGSEAGGRLTPQRLGAVLAEVCRSCRLDGAGARLVKFTNSAVFDLPTAGVVAKVAGSRLVASRVPRVITVARWLEAQGFPAVRLVDDVAQPVDALGHVVTLWRRVEPVGPAPTGADLGRLVRRFHALRAPDGLASWASTAGIRQRLVEADGAGDEDLAFLARRCDEVEDELARLHPVLPEGVIHGDAFLGNLIPSEDGPVMCDFDGTTVGPREWDMVPIAVSSLRFDHGDDDPWPSFRDAYGFDVTAWEGFGCLRRLRELQVLSSVLPVLAANPRVRPQFEHRLASLQAGDSARWQPYSWSFGPG